MQNFKKNIPNLLTIFRIILVIPIIVLLFIPKLLENKIFEFNVGSINLSSNLSFVLVLVLFIIASITDFFDGFLARKYNVISIFGKIVDPIADKILVNTIMIILASYNYILLPIVILMIIRDIIIDAIRLYAVSNKIDISANIWGKIKTFVQMIAIIFILLISTNNYNWWFFAIQNFLFYVSLFFSVISLILYAKNFIYSCKKNS